MRGQSDVTRKIPAIALVLLSAGAIAVLSDSALSPSWVMVILGAVVALLPFAAAALRGRMDVFQPIYLFSFCYAVLFVVRPAFDLAGNGSTQWLGYPIASGYFLALVIGLIGAIGFYCGYAAPIGARAAGRMPLPTGKWAISSLAGFVMASVLVSGLLFTAFVWSIGGFGNVGALLAGRSEFLRQAQIASSGYLYSAPLWLGSIGLLILAIVRRWRSAAGLLGFLLVVASQVESLAFGDRSWWLPMATSIGILFYCRRGRRPGARTLATTAVLVLLFGITVPRMYREADNRTQSFAQVIQQTASSPFDALQSLFQSLDTAMVDGLAMEAQDVPSAIPYQFGSTYLEALTRPVPRSLWSGKPIEAEALLMQRLLPDLASRHILFYFSAFGEPYLNLGLPGVLLFGFVFGAAWRLLYEWFRRAPTNPCVFAIYAASWPCLFIYMRGGVGVDYQRQVIMILPMILAMYVAYARRSTKVTPDGDRLTSDSPRVAGAATIEA